MAGILLHEILRGGGAEMIRWWAYEVRFEQEVYAKTMARSSSKYRCSPAKSVGKHLDDSLHENLEEP